MEGTAERLGIWLGMAEVEGTAERLGDWLGIAEFEGTVDRLGTPLGTIDGATDRLGVSLGTVEGATDRLGTKLGAADGNDDRLGVAEGNDDSLGCEDGSADWPFVGAADKRQVSAIVFQGTRRGRHRRGLTQLLISLAYSGAARLSRTGRTMVPSPFFRGMRARLRQGRRGNFGRLKRLQQAVLFSRPQALWLPIAILVKVWDRSVADWYLLNGSLHLTVAETPILSVPTKSHLTVL